MPNYHTLKTWPEFFKAVWDGYKTFEIRRNDRNFQVGDILRLLEYYPDRNEFSGKTIDSKVTYVLQGGQFGVEKGYVILGIKMICTGTGDSEYFNKTYLDKNKDTPEENHSKLPTLEDKVTALEHKVDTLFTEVFSAWHGTIGKDYESSRTTLKGTVDKLCDKIGVEPVRAPWSKKVSKHYEYETTDPAKLRSCLDCFNHRYIHVSTICNGCKNFSKYIPESK